MADNSAIGLAFLGLLALAGASSGTPSGCPQGFHKDATGACIPDTQPVNDKYSMISVTTWHTEAQSGLHNIDFTAITRLTIFAMNQHPDGSLTYNTAGNTGTLDPLNAVTIAKRANVKTMLGIGGQGTAVSTAAWNSILTDPIKRATFITNALAEVDRIGYDGIHMDAEHFTGNDINGALYIELIKEIRTRRPNIIIDVTVEQWQSGPQWDYKSLEPYVDHLLFMFNLSAPVAANIAASMHTPVKLCIGYDLSQTPNPTFLKGYNVFVWEASRATPAIYAEMKAAIQ